MGSEASCCAASPTSPDKAQGRGDSVAVDEPQVISTERGAGGQRHMRHPSRSGDEDENMDAAEDQRRLDNMKGKSRRAGVAAPAISATEVKDYVKPVYAKIPETVQALKAVIKGSDKLQVLFGHLDQAALDDIVNAFQETSRRRGEHVITQGDEGDCLYIINEGTVDVFVARPDAQGKLNGSKGTKVVSLSSGALFGELALMYSAPRAATVCITSDVSRLWRLDREPFKMLLAQQSQNQYEMYEGWLSEVAILSCLNKYELSRLSELLESTLYDPDEPIITQGEPGDKFYMLEDGVCAAYIQGPRGERKVKEYTMRGQYFGEIALLNNEPRKATVRAGEKGALVLSVSADDFANLLGPIQEMLKKDIGKYPQYADFLKG